MFSDDHRQLWASLTQFPETPTSCQGIKTILLPLTQEQFNEAARREESLISQGSQELIDGVELVILGVTGLYPGQEA